MTTCKKCQGEMKTGKALNNPTIEGSEGHGTRRRVISNAVVECLKCVDCGHSFIPKSPDLDSRIAALAKRLNERNN